MENMPEDLSNITVTATTRLIKYDVGVDPATGEPFEVIENTKVYTGQEAIDILNQLNKEGNPSATD